jgi:hypothetical protein
VVSARDFCCGACGGEGMTPGLFLACQPLRLWASNDPLGADRLVALGVDGMPLPGGRVIRDEGVVLP